MNVIALEQPFQSHFMLPFRQNLPLLIQPAVTLISTHSMPIQHSLIPLGTMNPRIKQIDNYTVYLDHKMGSGSSSIVYRAKDNRTNEEVCVKSVECCGLATHQKNMLFRESTILMKIHHPNVLRCHDVIDKGTNLYIITEFCPQGDLLQKITAEGPMQQYIAFQYMKGVANALLSLKKHGIIHRDLKPSNVLLKDGTTKLADFGFAIHESQAQAESMLNVGSPLYMAPEVLFNNRYSYASDIYAFGIMYYELLHMATPYESSCQEELRMKLACSTPFKFRDGLGAGVKQLIMGCLHKDPYFRPTIQQIMACFH